MSFLMPRWPRGAGGRQLLSSHSMRSSWRADASPWSRLPFFVGGSRTTRSAFELCHVASLRVVNFAGRGALPVERTPAWAFLMPQTTKPPAFVKSVQ